jgi:hypothetical protein
VQDAGQACVDREVLFSRLDIKHVSIPHILMTKTYLSRRAIKLSLQVTHTLMGSNFYAALGALAKRDSDSSEEQF